MIAPPSGNLTNYLVAPLITIRSHRARINSSTLTHHKKQQIDEEAATGFSVADAIPFTKLSHSVHSVPSRHLPIHQLNAAL